MTATVTLLNPTLQQQLIVDDPQWQKTLQQLKLASANTSLVFTDGTNAYGWLSLWWKNTPSYQQLKTACIGHYYVQTAQAASALLQQAEKLLRAQAMEYAIAPMDGNTWHSYRLSTKTSDVNLDMQSREYPPFFLDCITPPHWNTHFTTENYQSIANYASTSTTQLDYEEAAAVAWQKRFHNDPLCELRNLDLEHIDTQLQELHDLSLRGFKQNFLYTNITLSEFKQLYEPILPYVVPNLVQLAYINNRLAGFVFAVPDYAQKARGEAIDTLILKTFVRNPAPELRGLGAYLIWNTHQLAKQHGYKQLITAFMHENNISLQLALKASHIIRNYTLYGKPL